MRYKIVDKSQNIPKQQNLQMNQNKRLSDLMHNRNNFQENLNKLLHAN